MMSRGCTKLGLPESSLVGGRGGKNGELSPVTSGLGFLLEDSRRRSSSYGGAQRSK